MLDRDSDLLDWAASAVGQKFPGAKVRKVDALRGDLSTRRFWRLYLDAPSAASAILVDLGPDDLPGYARALNLVPHPLNEPPWLTVHRFLESLGISVPAMYAVDRKHRVMMVEDVGEIALVDAVRRDPAQTADLFRTAVELLLQFHVEGTRAILPDLLPATIAYDARLFRWEFKEFLDLGCADLGADAGSLAPELDALAAELGSLPRVFSHRDFHGQNLFVQPGNGGVRLRVIDFQDALMAPAGQDLAVLMTTRDTANLISPSLEQRLLDFYYAGLTRRSAATLRMDEFIRSYRLCVLQHAIKMMGRFLMFERKGKHGYLAFVPHTIEQSRRILRGELGRDFPRLALAFGASSEVTAQ